ncbi:expansin EXLX1 family cellulose-binding protein [Nocardia huaxiensis]|uniref:RlpA-like protein double-psi beta-barrel domain-containing protein n=1 Tax=Nocardia huaxiensis TaxID=2755382 RepID=A0A7D6VE75_9NOCA|nr:expansin EXLX1 family cellulose-binding protein [Nocardia huaxiensis]QLY27690.1 hypothetical protein H0264_19685 [Nocardia huaxiensis]UFS98921.1 hypothetical protein LPY97_14015 [Nocardia huaxiensis]
MWTALTGAVVVGAVTWMMWPQPAACRTAAPRTTVVTVPAPTPSSVTAQQLPVTESVAATERGEARFYSFTPGVACSLPDLPLDGYYVGVPTSEYAGSDPCGSYIDIDGPRGSVRAQIVDRCPGCAPHQYDLSRAAFEAIANPTDGVAQIRFTRVRDPNPAPELFYRVQPGSNADWMGLLVGGSGNPIGQVSLLPASGGDPIPLRRGYDNVWSVSGAGAGPFTVVVTDNFGHIAWLPDLTIEPGALRYTGIRLYEIPAPEAVAAPPTTPAPVVITTVVPAPAVCED